jgi:hypothetical protein
MLGSTAQHLVAPPTWDPDFVRFWSTEKVTVNNELGYIWKEEFLVHLTVPFHHLPAEIVGKLEVNLEN